MCSLERLEVEIWQVLVVEKDVRQIGSSAELLPEALTSAPYWLVVCRRPPFLFQAELVIIH